eukprot:gene5704-10953_t
MEPSFITEHEYADIFGENSDKEEFFGFAEDEVRSDVGFSDLASSYSDSDVVEEEQSGDEVGDVLGQNAWARDLTDTDCLEFQEETAEEPKCGEQGYDCLFKVRHILEHTRENFKKAYKPGRNLSIDEGMIAYKERIGFKQYMPQKPTKGKKGVQEVVEKPAVVCLYNAYMIGVDLSDQLRSYYPLGRKGHRWYKYIFWLIFDVSVGNAMVFRQSLAMQMIGGYCGRKSAMKKNIAYNRCDPETIREEAKYVHSICKIEGRKKECIQCKRLGRKIPKRRPRETSWKCSHCDIPLCKDNCFLEYHS